MEMVMKFQANLLGVQLKSERASIDKSSTKIFCLVQICSLFLFLRSAIHSWLLHIMKLKKL